MVIRVSCARKIQHRMCALEVHSGSPIKQITTHVPIGDLTCVAHKAET